MKYNLKLSATTEVWDFKTLRSRTLNSFEDREYYKPALFLVDPNFCVQEMYPTAVPFPTFGTSYVTSHPKFYFQTSP